MNRHVGMIAGCLVGMVVGEAAVAQTGPSSSPIRSFDWTYQGTPEPGNRHWSSPDGVTWTETYPSGHTETQTVAAAAQVGGCSGVVTVKRDAASIQTFVPNPGCPFMVLLTRVGSQPWQPLGIMQSISTRFTAAAAAAAAPSPGQVRIGLGSGIFVNANGVVLTDAHVVSGCKALQIKAFGAVAAPGVLEAVDPKNDLALVRTHAGYGAPAVFRAQTKPARLGESIGVVGYPLPGVLSSEPKATFGQINSVAGMNNDYTLLQISAPVQPGNSGGPVLGEDGMVLGIVVAQASPALIALTGSIPQNINFAVRGEIAQIFMTAHGVAFRSRESGERLETADIAEGGEKSTAQVLCLKS